MKSSLLVLSLALSLGIPSQAALIYLDGGDKNEKVGSNDPAAHLTWLKTLVDCDDLTFYAGDSDGALGDIDSYTSPDPLTHDYVTFHGGQGVIAFMIDGTSPFTVTKSDIQDWFDTEGVDTKFGGFSTVYYFDCEDPEEGEGVPDGGTTALLGALAFGGLGLLRRFIR